MPASTHIARITRHTPLLVTAALAITITVALLAPGPALASSLSLTEGQPFNGEVGQLSLACSLEGIPDEFLYYDCSNLLPTEPAVIAWGDGTVTTVTAALDSSNPNCNLSASASCTYDVTGGHAFRVGQYQLSYSISYSYDSQGFPVQDTVTGADSAAVADAPLTLRPGSALSEAAGSSPSLALATLSDADPAAVSGYYSISVDWGDGNSGEGGPATAAGAPGGFVIHGSHAYARIGNYTATVTVKDYGGAPSVTTRTSIAVTPASLSVTGGTGLTGTADASTGPLQLATVTDTNAFATASDFHASVAWGDGTTSEAGVAALSPGRFSLTGTHTYARPGNFTATITVDDGNDAHAIATTTISVAAAHGVICAAPSTGVHGSEGAPLTAVALARFADTNPNLASGDFTATVDWGDATPLATGTVASDGGQSPPCIGLEFDVKSTHTYAEAGTYTVSVSIADHSGAASLVTTTISVTDQSLTAHAAPALLLKRGQFSGTVLVANFSDANPLGQVSDYRATIDWGDGTPRTAGTIATTAGQSFAVTGDHTYDSIGTHHIIVTVADHGGAGTSTRTAAVVKPVPLSGGVREYFHSTGSRPFYTTIASLLVKNAARASRVLVRCRGNGCPYARRTVSVRNGALNLARGFRHKRLTPGTRFSIALTAPGWCGKYWAYKVRAAALPADFGPTYLAPGATRPGKKC